MRQFLLRNVKYKIQFVECANLGWDKRIFFYKNYKIYFPYDIDYFFIPGIHLYSCTRDIVTNIAGWVSDNAKLGG